VARHSRFKEHREESSKGHIEIGELLKKQFPICRIYQEYPMDLILKRGYRDQKVETEFQDQFMLKRARALRVDWVVLDLRLIVEFHGAHHFQPVDYGDGKGSESYQHRLHLDGVKRRIAREADFHLIEWPHFEALTEASLAAKIDEVLGYGRPG
jgi:hypothetical protein